MKMRTRYAIISFLFALIAHAQNWALLNPAYKYNYSNDGSDTISNQIFVTHIDTLGSDSVLHTLNPVVGACGIGDSAYVYHIDLTTPQFLMRHCLVHNSTWTFSDTATYVIPSTAGLGATWTFRPDDNVQATIISVSTALVLGELDSVKTMVSNAADIVVWSKAHGLMHWALAGGPAYFLVGIHGPDIGHLIPSLSDFYPYHAGDVVQYCSGSWANYHSFVTYSQLHITGRTDYADSIVFTGTWHWAFSGPYNYWAYGSNNTPLRVAKTTSFLLNAATSYPGEFIRDTSYPDEAMIAKHGLNGDGYYEIRNTAGGLDPLLALMQIVNDSNTTCSVVGSLADPYDSYWIIDAQVGLRGYRIDQIYQGDYLIWQGALINGVQIGTLDSAAFFHVGMAEEQAHQNILLVPNPVDDKLTLLHVRGSATSFSILDITGQLLKSDAFTPGPSPSIDVSMLPEGMYLLNVTTTQGSSSQRFVIAR